MRIELFGKGGGQAIADFSKSPLLGQLPIDPQVREWGDKGTPVVKTAPDSVVALAVMAVAERLVQLVAEKAEAGQDAAPEIDREGGPGGKKRLTVV